MSDPTDAPDDATSEADPSAVVDFLDLELLKPVKLGKETTAVLHLTEPTVKQLRDSLRGGPNGLDQIAALIAINAHVLPAVVDRMCKRDLDRASAFFDRFGTD